MPRPTRPEHCVARVRRGGSETERSFGRIQTGSVEIDTVEAVEELRPELKPTRPWTSPNGPAASLLSREDLEILQFGSPMVSQFLVE